MYFNHNNFVIPKKTTYIISKLLQRHYSLIFCVMAAFFNSKVNSIEKGEKPGVSQGKTRVSGLEFLGQNPGFRVRVYPGWQP